MRKVIDLRLALPAAILLVAWAACAGVAAPLPSGAALEQRGGNSGGIRLSENAMHAHALRSPSLAVVDANARAEGNRRAVAVALGTVLFDRVWPAQLMKVRVDGIGRHEVAGLVLSGVKFHGSVDARSFADEVTALVQRSFAAVPVEEVDVWATTPLDVARGTVVAGDNAQPTSRVVFGITVRRAEAARLRRRIAVGGGIYWNRGWKMSLRGGRLSRDESFERERRSL